MKKNLIKLGHMALDIGAAVVIGAMLLVVATRAKADWPEAYYNPERGRYYLPEQERHLRLDVERLRARQAERRAAERERERARELERERAARQAYVRDRYVNPQVRGWIKTEPQVWTERDHCKAAMPAAGVEAHSEEQALLTARVQWSSQVRWAYGEQYMDWDNARGKDKSCSQSSNDATNVLGKMVQGAVENLTTKSYARIRCEVRAHPCRAPVQHDVDK